MEKDIIQEVISLVKEGRTEEAAELYLDPINGPLKKNSPIPEPHLDKFSEELTGEQNNLLYKHFCSILIKRTHSFKENQE